MNGSHASIPTEWNAKHVRIEVDADVGRGCLLADGVSVPEVLLSLHQPSRKIGKGEFKVRYEPRVGKSCWRVEINGEVTDKRSGDRCHVHPAPIGLCRQQAPRRCMFTVFETRPQAYRRPQRTRNRSRYVQVHGIPVIVNFGRCVDNSPEAIGIRIKQVEPVIHLWKDGWICKIQQDPSLVRKREFDITDFVINRSGEACQRRRSPLADLVFAFERSLEEFLLVHSLSRQAGSAHVPDFACCDRTALIYRQCHEVVVAPDRPGIQRNSVSFPVILSIEHIKIHFGQRRRPILKTARHA